MLSVGNSGINEVVLQKELEKARAELKTALDALLTLESLSKVELAEMAAKNKKLSSVIDKALPVLRIAVGLIAGDTKEKSIKETLEMKEALTNLSDALANLGPLITGKPK